MPGSSELPDHNQKATHRIDGESKSDEFGAARWLLPTINRTQKAFSNSSPVPNEVVLEGKFCELRRYGVLRNSHGPGPTPMGVVAFDRVLAGIIQTSS